MTLTELVFAFAWFSMFIAAVLFVVVGQVTVRRLRKNPETRESLGLEFASGWDILNVAGALSRPKWFSKMMRNSPMSFMAADERPLYEHTSVIERVLARVFFGSWMISVLLLFSVLVMDKFGVDR